jgi:hypothetical protein
VFRSRLELAALVVSSSVIAIAIAGCARGTPVNTSVPVHDNYQWAAELTAADELVRSGCFGCLQEALREYEAVDAGASVPAAVRTKAALGAARAAVLLDARERELGTIDDHYRDRARRALERELQLQSARSAQSAQSAQSAMAAAFDLIEYVPWRVAEAGSASEDERLMRSAELAQNRETWRARYVEKAADTAFDAYMWLTFACESGLARTLTTEELVRPVASLENAPLLAYKLATCPRINTDALNIILQRDARFAEVNYFLGVQAILRGKPEEAEAALQRAYDWRHSECARRNC